MPFNDQPPEAIITPVKVVEIFSPNKIMIQLLAVNSLVARGTAKHKDITDKIVVAADSDPVPVAPEQEFEGEPAASDPVTSATKQEFEYPRLEWEKLEPFDLKSIKPELDMHVLYKDDKDSTGIPKRGLITNLCRDTYHVFLWDEGKVGIAKIDQIRPYLVTKARKSQLVEIKPRFIILELAGFYPKSSSTTGLPGFPSTSWSKDAMDFVKEWVNSGQAFAQVLCQYGDLSCYGDILIQNDPKPLSQHLQDKQFGYIKHDFVEQLVDKIELRYAETPLLAFLQNVELPDVIKEMVKKEEDPTPELQPQQMQNDCINVDIEPFESDNDDDDVVGGFEFSVSDSNMENLVNQYRALKMFDPDN